MQKNEIGIRKLTWKINSSNTIHEIVSVSKFILDLQKNKGRKNRRRKKLGKSPVRKP